MIRGAGHAGPGSDASKQVENKQQARNTQQALREATSMIKLAKGLIRDERGEDLMEYGLLVAFIATIALAVIITDPLGFGTAIQDAYQRAVDALNQA